MLPHTGEADFPIEVTEAVPATPTPTFATQPRGWSRLPFLTLAMVPLAVMATWIYARQPTPASKPVPAKVAIRDDAEIIRRVVGSTARLKEKELGGATILPPQPPLVNPESSTFLTLPDDVFTPLPVKNEPRIVKQSEPVKELIQVGDSLGGVMDANNKWLQADIHNVIVVAKDRPVIKSIDTEMEEVAKFLTTKANPAEAPFLRFFTFYAMPTEAEFTIGVNGADVPISLRQAGLLVLSFVLNSTAHIERSLGNVVTPTMLPGSDTICYINIQDFGWTPEQWDRVSKTDPYIAEPLVQHSAYNLARLAGGNMLFRGDWFIAHATDTQRQVDAKINELIYYTLLFDQKVPKNGKEFRDVLGINLEAALKDNLDRRAIMEAGKSGVSVETGGNRKVQGIRTPFGYYWETFDTKNLDYLNNLELDDKVKDAGELIASHKNGMQVYLLVNQDDKRVEFADNGLVEFTNPLGKKTGRPVDRRVKTAVGCIVCHPNGINPLTNSIVESLQEGVQLNVLVHQGNYDSYANYEEFRKAREKYLKLDRKYVNNGINAVIEADNRIYEQAVQQANGLIPSQNAYLLWAVTSWYDKPLNLKQAAAETGYTPSEFVERTHGCISIRVNRIVASDKFSIPRKYWESLEPAGDYAHSVLTIKLHTPQEVKVALEAYPGHPVAVATQPVVKAVTQDAKPAPEPKTITAVVDCPVLVTENGVQYNLGTLGKGTAAEYIAFDGTWYQINFNGRVGFVFHANCTEGKVK